MRLDFARLDRLSEYAEARKTEKLIARIEDFDLSLCADEDLRPLEQMWNAPDEDLDEVRPELETLQGDDLANFAIDYLNAEETSKSFAQRQRAMMHMFRVAASQGSAISMNEIGASALYCYQDVEQDAVKARQWLEKAADLDDEYAHQSLAMMHWHGLIDSEDPVAATRHHLQRCHDLGGEDCEELLESMEASLHQSQSSGSE